MRAAIMPRACAARGAFSLCVRWLGTACAVCAMWARATGRVACRRVGGRRMSGRRDPRAISGRILCVGSGRSLASRRAGGRRVGRERRRGRCSAGGLTDVFADVFAWIGTSGVSRLRALRAWLGSRRLRSRRACVSVVVPRAASGVGLAECAHTHTHTHFRLHRDATITRSPYAYT